MAVGVAFECAPMYVQWLKFKGKHNLLFTLKCFDLITNSNASILFRISLSLLEFNYICIHLLTYTLLLLTYFLSSMTPGDDVFFYNGKK